MTAPHRAVVSAERDQDRAQRVGVRAERAGEDRPVEARDGVDAELDHDAREEDADGRRRDRVRVGQPEVQRHGGGLGKKAEEQQRHRDDHERVDVVAVERGADLGHVERPGARVQQRRCR